MFQGTTSEKCGLMVIHKSKNGDEFSRDIMNMRDFTRSFIAGIMLSFTLMIPPSDFQTDPSWFVASAKEASVSMTEKTVEPPRSKVGALPDKKSDIGESIFDDSLSDVKNMKDFSLVEEVWTLEDKFFLDPTYNKQNWNEIRQRFLKEEKQDTSEEKSMQLITKMTKSLGDKYSRILDPQGYTAIQKYDLIGVGVTLMPNADKAIIVGAPPIAGSAADKAGMKAGDFVSAVNGVSTKGRNAFDIIDQISENPNAKILTMTVRTQGRNDLPGEGLTRDLTMDRIFSKVQNPITYAISKNRKDGKIVGYIRIKEFNSLVKAKLQDALTDLKGQGANAYVLDVRGNPGGAFQSAAEISSLFVDDRVAAYVVDRNQVEVPFRTAGGSMLISKEDPMVIWIDGGSASASEALTGSLHDNCRAIVMGDTSFGKGVVQAVYGLNNGAGLVLTVAKYLTPSGGDIQGIGIVPDIKGGLPSSFLPILSSDTSSVNFEEVSKMLSMCKIPSPR